MKYMALYLPQFHRTKENDEWWGDGYTEWTAVKNAKPLFPKHNQPNVPLNSNYYDLVKDGIRTWRWQAELAKEYGVYGFCIYHYWFTGKQLLEKPMEILRDNKDIEINYCICWANESWTKTWYGLESVVLMKQEYGGEQEWTDHFNYLNTFFQDPRYIKIDNKPVVNIYRTMDIKCLKEMLSTWDKLAVENGFNGLYIVSGNTARKEETREELIDAKYVFEPGHTLHHSWRGLSKTKYILRTAFIKKANKVCKQKRVEHLINGPQFVKYLGQNNSGSIKVYYGVFPRWDNTPRRSYKGLVYNKMTPELFRKQLETVKSLMDDPDDFIYINAWNEWGEGAMLEPEEVYQYGYLKVLKEMQE